MNDMSLLRLAVESPAVSLKIDYITSLRKDMRQMRKEKTTVIERENDWLWVELGLPYNSAVDALNAIKSYDAKRGGSTIRIIDWEATSMPGKYAILAITGKCQ